MKKINNCYYLTFKDLISALDNCYFEQPWHLQTVYQSTDDIMSNHLTWLMTNVQDLRYNFMLGHILETTNDIISDDSSIGYKLLKALVERYGDCYTVSYDKIYDFSDIMTLPSSDEKYLAGREQEYQAIMYMNKIINRIQLTYPKYNTLLSIYDTEASNLMDGINNSYTDTRTETTSGSSSGNNRLNDTPQDTGTFTDDSHTSSYSENESEASSSLSSTFTHTATDDVEILIDRLDKVQNKYQNLMKRWVDEFKDMFIMPVALDCEVNLNE